MTTALVKPKTCTRCKGTGHRPGFDHVRLGICFGCNGRGEVEGDRATLAARKARSEARSALGKAAWAAGPDAHLGLSLLERDEPARLDKALDSFLAGRTDVVDALVTYARSRREV
jgi:hypothetical protein